MSLLLYSGPRRKKKWSSGGREELDFKDLEKKAKATKKWIHPKLRFEEIIKNKPLPPCSLNDFMDYLVYVEREAETLQFFLWYYDYVRRWVKLHPAKKATAPKWDPGNKRPLTSHSRKGSLKEKVKLNSILDILDREAGPDSRIYHHRYQSSSATNFSLPRSPETAATGEDEKTWEPFSTQPYRDEINQIVRHYIISGAPRQLYLSSQDRQACIHGAEHTTHPSALLPAFISAEAMLRGRLHPNFISWSISNSNRPLVIASRLLSVLLLLLAAGLDAFLILTDWSRLWRLTCLPLFFTAFCVIIASGSGLSLALHLRGARQLRPWEQAADVEAAAAAAGYSKKHLRKNTGDSVLSFDADPLRKGSLRPLGPKNDFWDEEWVRVYEKKWLFRRVLDGTVPVQNRHVSVLQDAVVAGSVLWGSLIAILLTAGSIFVPALGYISV
ncbi:uncharacterized protein DNG_06126 [Cephalotrichum gorgonifer]|uniref:RGS domain-containing protein n=1 Tax=Cephalotrichum gorgonifer TaxID=2041049 RepID=A0AAE8N1N9_9PEZI|nr:uncharacterized protein DNG_06126 [Cephalotrichum gorgonifer]